MGAGGAVRPVKENENVVEAHLALTMFVLASNIGSSSNSNSDSDSKRLVLLFTFTRRFYVDPATANRDTALPRMALTLPFRHAPTVSFSLLSCPAGIFSLENSRK